MKVALLLSGQIRDGVDIYEFFYKNFLCHYDVDVFISVWDDENLNEFIKIYNPVSVEVEKYTDLFKNSFYNKTIEFLPKLETNANLISLTSMWCKTKSVGELKIKYEEITKTKYDVVVKTRPDLKLEERITFDGIKDNTVYIPYGWNWSGGINDLLVYGDSNSVKKYCFLFDELVYLLKELDTINPEKVLQRYLRTKTNLKIKRPIIDMSLRNCNIKDTYFTNEVWNL